MKLLVFAHTPPPHHGQSYMVQLMLDGLTPAKTPPGPSHTAERSIDCYHVNARLSKELADIGDFRLTKFFLVLLYSLRAIWYRFRYGVTNFYYIPAPGKKSALYRDWVVFVLCRPFFKHFILHWHASGLARWLETAVQMKHRSLTYRFLKHVDLSIVLSDYGRSDAEKLYPMRITVVPNGIPDPCPDFGRELLERRHARVQARRLLASGNPLPFNAPAKAGADPHVLRVLFMAHCTRDKGLFDAVEGVILASRKLAAEKSPVSIRMIVAGQFVLPSDEEEFHRIRNNEGRGVIEYAGFVAGEQKRKLFEEADIFCFPSHLESFGLVLVEAMAFGLPIVTTRCGAVPEVMSPDYPGLVDPHAPQQIADALLRMMNKEEVFESLRLRFERNFTLERYVSNIRAALLTIETEHAPTATNPLLYRPSPSK